jgi:hypothetical protein
MEFSLFLEVMSKASLSYSKEFGQPGPFICSFIHFTNTYGTLLSVALHATHQGAIVGRTDMVLTLRLELQ